MARAVLSGLRMICKRPLITILTLVAFGGVVGATVDDAARTLDLYKRYTYLNVTTHEAREQFEQVKITGGFNPKLKMQNVDPEWIPGWNDLSLTDETQTAVLQAAINRTWTAKIHEDYQQYRAAWADIEKQLRPELERANAIPGYYERATALRKLLEDTRAAAKAHNVLYPAGYAPATVGFQDEIVRAMISLHNDAKTEVLLGAYLKSAGVNLADFTEHGRGFAPDEVEQDLFTAPAVKVGTTVTPPLPRMNEYGHAFAAVKWPVSKERRAEIEKVSSQLVADETTAHTPAHVVQHIVELDSAETPDAADPKLRHVIGGLGLTGFGPVKVTKVGKGAVELESVDKHQVPYNCKWTGDWDANGEKVMSCHYRSETWVRAFTVSTAGAAVPEGLELQKGDVVELYADLDSTKAGKDKTTFHMMLRAVVSVKRGDKEIASYW
jgi:hypothetical protein